MPHQTEQWESNGGGTAGDPAAGMQVTNMGRVLFLASLATILLIGDADGLAAQGRGGVGASGSVHASATAAPRAAGRVTSSPGSHLAIPRSPSGQILPRRAGTTVRATGRYSGSTTARTRQFRSTRGLDFSEQSNVPGLGFDAVHVAATRGNRGGGGRRDGRDGRGRGNEFGVLFPFFDGGGYYVPTGPDISGDVPDDGQAVDEAEDQGPEPDDRPYDRAPRAASVNRPPVEQPAPQPEASEYVFVRRDGTVFFAVAFSWDAGSLRYISSEGTRRSVSRDTLDLKATEEFNEQRGLTFRSPA